MPRARNKNKKHRTSTRHPTVCCRWSEKDGRWLWGYRIIVRDGGKRKRIHVHEFDSFEKAENIIAALKQAAKAEKYGLHPDVSRPLLTDLVARQLRALKGRQEFTRAARVLNCWLALLPPALRVDEADTPHVQAFIDRRLADGIAPASIDREINIIVACLNSARIHYRELRQWRLPPIPRPKFPKVTTRKPIPPDDYRRLLAHLTRPRGQGEQKQAAEARQRVGRLLRFAMLTGCRSKEIFQLKLDQIEREFLRLRIVATKTDDVRYVPITEECAAVLREQIEENRRTRKTLHDKSSPFVFTLGGNPTPKIYRVLRDACQSVGLAEIELYQARHTFITSLLHAGADAKTVGQIVGHSDETMTLYYTHATPESFANVADKLHQIEQARLGEITSK